MTSKIYIASTPSTLGSFYSYYLKHFNHADYLNGLRFKYYINNCRFLLSRRYSNTMLATVNTQNQTHSKHSLHAKKGNKLCIIKVRRTKEGTEIFAKSPILEKFFSKYGVDSFDHSRWHGIDYPHHLPSVIASDTIRRTLDAWGDDILSIYNELPNLSILRAQGLSRGVKIVMPRLVTTRKQMDLYESKAKDIVNRLYTDVIKPDIMQHGDHYGIK